MTATKKERLELYEKFDLPSLEKLRDAYVAQKDQDSAEIVREAIAGFGKVQTEELSRCGRLFKHTRVDSETGRVTHSFTGDIGAMLAPFAVGGGPIVARMNWRQFTGANSPEARAYAATQRTVTVQPGERVMVVKE